MCLCVNLCGYVPYVCVVCVCVDASEQGAAGPVDVLPVAGRLAMFVSDEVAHEVMPAFSKRHSVTLWFYDALEHAEALAASKVYSAAGSAPRAQAQARELLRDMLADTVPGDEEGEWTLLTRTAMHHD